MFSSRQNLQVFFLRTTIFMFCRRVRTLAERRMKNKCLKYSTVLLICRVAVGLQYDSS